MVTPYWACGLGPVWPIVIFNSRLKREQIPDKPGMSGSRPELEIFLPSAHNCTCIFV